MSDYPVTVYAVSANDGFSKNNGGLYEK